MDHHHLHETVHIHGTSQIYPLISDCTLRTLLLRAISSTTHNTSGLTETGTNNKLTWHKAIARASSLHLSRRLHEHTLTNSLTTVIVRLKSSFTAIIACLAVLIDGIVLVPVPWEWGAEEAARIMVDTHASALISTSQGLWEADYVLNMTNARGFAIDDDSGGSLPNSCVHISTAATVTESIPFTHDAEMHDEPCLISYDASQQVGVMFSHRAVTSWAVSLNAKYQSTYLNRPKGEIMNAETCMALIFPCVLGLDAHFAPTTMPSSKSIRHVGPHTHQRLSAPHLQIVTSLVLWTQHHQTGKEKGTVVIPPVIECGLLCDSQILSLPLVAGQVGRLCICGPGIPMSLLNNPTLSTETFRTDEIGRLWFVTTDVVIVGADGWQLVVGNTTSTSSRRRRLPTPPRLHSPAAAVPKKQQQTETKKIEMKDADNNGRSGSYSKL